MIFMNRLSISFLPVFLLCALPGIIAQTAGDGPVVTTEAGKVQGRVLNGISVFKNIPYAAAPVGSLKFAAPARQAAWTGVRDAVEEGPTAPFNIPPSPDISPDAVFGKGWVKGGDYLTVNIWTPDVSTGNLPVMVYIHGGAFVLGTANVPLFDGRQFATKGVVMVSLNYRLGIEGFLKIKDVPSNLGIRDQLAALQWVKNNIVAFGGDPGNVTIFGESAGGMSVAVLSVCPAAKGLFKRAIMLSGSGQAVFSSEQADRIAKAYTKKLKIKNTVKDWSKFTPEQLLAAQAQVTPKMVNLETEEYADPTGGAVMFFPVIDGDIVPDLPLKSLENGVADNVDLLLGYNSDEANYFLVPMGLMKKIKYNFILNKAIKLVHPAPSAISAVYKKAYPKKTLGEIFSSILTAYQFLVPAVRFADQHAGRKNNTYMYEFAWPSSVAKGIYGAYHGIALPFVFNNLDIVKGEGKMLGTGNVDPKLAKNMQDAFVKFAKTGNPGWEAYTPTERKTMLINNEWLLQTNPHKKEISIWDGVR